MNRIEPESLSGPRAYFTDFDHRIVARTSNLPALRKRGERKLKALLLLKGQIVCAASHLATKFSYEFFRENPSLLETGAIAPAFRNDKSDIDELFVRKRFKDKDSAIVFFKERIQNTVNWDLDDNSMWFRDRFLADLEDERSLLGHYVARNTQGVLEELADEIRGGALLGRELIDRVTKPLPRKDRRLIQNYRELLYHMSGARVVNCESALPQENYIDYDLADLSQKRARLSEEQILSKLLIELVFDSLQKTLLPIELLDLLTFEDIMAIRQPLLASPFQKKYDSLVQDVTGTHSSDTQIIYRADALMMIRDDLAATFDLVLQEELPNFLRRKVLERTKELASVSSSVALGVAGAIPGVGLISSTVSVMKDTPALLFNIGQTYRSVKAVSDLDVYHASKERLLRHEIEHSDVTDKAALLDAVELLLNVVAMRIKL